MFSEVGLHGSPSSSSLTSLLGGSTMAVGAERLHVIIMKSNQHVWSFQEERKQFIMKIITSACISILLFVFCFFVQLKCCFFSQIAVAGCTAGQETKQLKLITGRRSSSCFAQKRSSAKNCILSLSKRPWDSSGKTVFVQLVCSIWEKHRIICIHTELVRGGMGPSRPPSRPRDPE